MMDQTPPLVSILINNYNYERFLGDAIDSALAQTYPSIEVVVVDDGSTDGSPDLIASYGDQVKAIYQSNQGQAAAFNRGFAESQGEIICFLDADDIFHRQKVEIIVKTWQDNTQAKWYFHPLELFDQDQQSEVVTQSELSIANQQIQLQDVRPAMKTGRLGDPFEFAIPPTSGMCFKRELAEKLLPMPSEGGIILNDSYLKFAALGISSGITINSKLAYQRIHDRNLFTTAKDNPHNNLKQQQTNTAIFLSTAYWLKTQFPSLTKYANNLFAVGLAMNWQLKSSDRKSQITIQNYYQSSSLSSLISIYLKSLYKSLLRK